MHQILNWCAHLYDNDNGKYRKGIDEISVLFTAYFFSAWVLVYVDLLVFLWRIFSIEWSKLKKTNKQDRSYSKKWQQLPLVLEQGRTTTGHRFCASLCLVKQPEKNDDLEALSKHTSQSTEEQGSGPYYHNVIWKVRRNVVWCHIAT